jgi:hypothetical protein
MLISFVNINPGCEQLIKISAHRSLPPVRLFTSNPRTRGFLILVARLTTREHNKIFLLCHYFAIVKKLWENESCHVGRNEMVGLKAKSGPPGNMNAFKHGLAAIQKRREESVTTEHEESVRQQILEGLIADKGGGSADIDGYQDSS